MKKRINNNVVLVAEHGQELIVMGRGVGFQVYPGDTIDVSLIEKKYLSSDALSVSQMTSMLDNVSADDIHLVKSIIAMAELFLQTTFDPNALFPLVNHITFAVQRYKDDLQLKSPIQWEVKHFYPKEMAASKLALDMINKQYNVVLSDTEQIFIALHFVNAQLNFPSMDKTVEFTSLMNSIVQIIRFQFHIDFDEESVVYNRFLTHLRYYLMRQQMNEQVAFENEELFNTLVDKFPEEMRCSQKIASFLYEKKGWLMNNEERLYLTLHIKNLTSMVAKHKQQ